MKKILSIFLAVLIALSCTTFCFAKKDVKNYVLLGDSIAQGFGIFNRDEACYGKIVADTLGYNYKNYGIDGYRSIDLVELLKTEEVQNSIKNADLISLSIGGNDYLQQNLPVIIFSILRGDFHYLDDIEEMFIENFANIISSVKKLNPKATLIVQTLYNPRVDLLRDIYAHATNRVNKNIRDYLSAHPGDFYLLDTVPFMEGHIECVAVDTVHPSAVGNEEIAKALIKKLNEIGITDCTEPVINKIGIDEIPFSSYIIRGIKIAIESVLNIFNF